MIKNIIKFAYTRLEPKSFHTIEYSQPIEQVLFHVIHARIKCNKGSTTCIN